MALHVIVLAAGKGTRMRSDVAKVLHVVADRPLLSWVLDAVGTLGAATTVVVVGHQADEVARLLPGEVTVAVQAEQRGTGHATSIGLEVVNAAASDTIVVVPGDMPLIRGATMRGLVSAHDDAAAAATVMSAIVFDPAGYGRVVRDGDRVVRIVEERDATPREHAISEINTSVYAFAAGVLEPALTRIGTDNDQGELYLTDVVAVLTADGHLVSAYLIDPSEAGGVNTVEELEAVSAQLAARHRTG